MQSMISKMAIQAALAGGVGMGTQFVKRFYKQTNVEEIENTVYLKNNAGLCDALNGISKLKTMEFKNIVIEIEDILTQQYTSTDAHMPWTVNRKMHNIICYTKKIVEKCKTSKDDDVIVAYLDCQTDFIPQLESQFETIIHNLLLDRNIS